MKNEPKSGGLPSVTRTLLPCCVSNGTPVSDGPVSETYDFFLLNLINPKLVEVKLSLHILAYFCV